MLPFPPLITKGSSFCHSLLWNVSDSQLPHRSFAASYPWLTPRSSSCMKQGTSWHLVFLPYVLLVLHSFCNIGEPWGFGCPTLFASPSAFSRVHRDQGGYPKLHIQANKPTHCLHCGEMIHVWRKMLACVNEHLITQWSSCCSLQKHPEAVRVHHIFYYLSLVIFPKTSSEMDLTLSSDCVFVAVCFLWGVL